MKFLTISIILALFACSVAFPANDDGDKATDDRANRQRRVTCDLLGFTGDAACAANCLSMGKAGGTCSNGICHCRQDKIVDLWKDRFGTVPPFTHPSYLDRYTTRSK